MKKVRRTAQKSRRSLFGKRRTQLGVAAGSRQTFRRLNSERLEDRVLMAADVAAPAFESPLAAYQWVAGERAFNPVAPNHNHHKPTDVDANMINSANDLREVVSALRNFGIGSLSSMGGEGEDPAAAQRRVYVDVTGDNYLSMTDALQVIQALRAEGEAGDVVALMPEISTTSTVTVGGTYNVNVLIQDLRAMDPNPNNFDDQTGEPIEDRGVFAAVTDLMYNPDLSGIPLPQFLSAGSAASRFGPTYANQDLSVLDQRVGEGKIRINGAVANLLVPPGEDQFTFATIPFQVGAVDDFATVNEDATSMIDVLGNDTSASGTQNIMTTFVNATGQVVLLFVESAAGENRNGQGVAETDIMFATDTVQISVPGAPTLTSVSDPPRGTASVMNGMVQYRPDDNFFGTDTFTYTITYPGGVTDTGTATVTVTNVADAPMANNDTFTGPANAVLTVPAPGVLANDTDADIDPNLAPTNPRNDRITVTDADDMTARGVAITVAADGSFSYDPRGVAAYQSVGAGQTLTDTFNYTISDKAGAMDSAVVTLSIQGVNDAPTAVDDMVETPVDTPVTFNVLTNDTDPDTGDVLSVTSNTNPASGTLTPGANGSFTYTPATGFEGVVTFDYTVSDGKGGSDTATVTIEVIGQLLRATPDAESVNEGTTNNNLTITDNDQTEPDAGAVNTRISALQGQAVGAGPITVATDRGGMVTYDPTQGGAFNAQQVQYTPPNPNFVGTDTFTYTIDDDTSETAGDPDNRPSTATVTITVVNVDNDGVVANDDTIATPVPGNQVFNQAAPGVLANDTDPDLQTVAAVRATVTSTLGATVMINADGSFSYDPRASAQIGALGAGQTLPDTFTYTATDNAGATDTAVVSLTVQGVNDVPAAGNGAVTTTEDAVATTLTGGNNNLSSLVVDPDQNEVLTFTAATITTAAGATVTVNANGTFSYDPRGSATLQALSVGEQATDSFTYTVRDASNQSATGTVNVTVTGVNDAPNAVDDTFSLDQENGLFQNLTVLANDTDIDGDTLTVSAVTQGSAGGTIEILPGGAGVRYRHANGFDGTETFTYTVSDGNGGTDTATVTVNVVAFIPSTISGYVYHEKDLNAGNNNKGNGVRSPSYEPGLGNVEVTLTGVDLQGNTVTRTVKTDATGRYVFTNLPPSNGAGYKLSVDGVPFMVDGPETASTTDDRNTTGGALPPGTTAMAPVDANGNTINQIMIFIPELGDVASVENNFSVLGLDPRFVSLADIIAQGSQASGTALASIGLDEDNDGDRDAGFVLPATGNGWENFAMPTIELSQNRMFATIRATRLSDGQLMTATVPVNTPLNGGTGAMVKIIGDNGAGGYLLRLSGSPTDYGFTPVQGNGEGEYADAVDAIFAENN